MTSQTVIGGSAVAQFFFSKTVDSYIIDNYSLHEQIT